MSAWPRRAHAHGELARWLAQSRDQNARCRTCFAQYSIIASSVTASSSRESMTQASRSSSAASLAAAAVAALSISFAAASLYKRRKLATTSSSNSDDSSLPYPPTPPSQHWLLGHALALQPDPTKPKVSHDILFESWMRKLNSKVVMFQLPVIGRFICVGDPTVARHVLMTTSFRKSPTYGGMVPLIGKKSMVATGPLFGA